jgi:hypothetical protein
MSIQATCRYIYILALSALFVSASTCAFAQADTTVSDTTDTDKKAPKVQAAGRQLCISADIFNPIVNQYRTNSYGYEFAADYFLHNEYYIVAEAGWGGSKVDYTDLQYTTTNTFLRAGFNKSMLLRDHPRDWDLMFFGLRAAVAPVTRSTATFSVTDSLWGSIPGAQPGKSFTALWAEVVGGMRVELFHGLFAGWAIRGKFMMKSRSFKDLSPLYIGGYGKGDKNAVFDFNFYLTYALRWGGAPKVMDAVTK